jgi:hypothetical protein
VVVENGGERARERIADAIRAAVIAERERCAKVIEQFDATDTDGEFIVPGLAAFDDRCQCYVPQAGAIAAHIRESGSGAGQKAPERPGPSRNGLWLYRHTDGQPYVCRASDDGAQLTWLDALPQGDWDDDGWVPLESGNAAGHDLGGES